MNAQSLQENEIIICAPGFGMYLAQKALQARLFYSRSTAKTLKIAGAVPVPTNNVEAILVESSGGMEKCMPLMYVCISALL